MNTLLKILLRQVIPCIGLAALAVSTAFGQLKFNPEVTRHRGAEGKMLTTADPSEIATIAEQNAKLKALMSGPVKRKVGLAYEGFLREVLKTKPSDVDKLALRCVDSKFINVAPRARDLLTFCVLADFVSDETVRRIVTSKDEDRKQTFRDLDKYFELHKQARETAKFDIIVRYNAAEETTLSLLNTRDETDAAVVQHLR